MTCRGTSPGYCMAMGHQDENHISAIFLENKSKIYVRFHFRTLSRYYVFLLMVLSLLSTLPLKKEVQEDRDRVLCDCCW